MRLIDLDIQRMPGFEARGIHYRGLEQGVNVIWGPNGSGKTTTCKAMKALLWPQSVNLHPLLLQSRWELEGEKIEILREGSKSKIPQELQGKLEALTTLAYFSALDDLFEDTKSDLAKLFLSEMHGGYDFSSLLQKFSLSPRFGFIEASQNANVKHELERVKREQTRIAERNEKLAALGEEIERGKGAKRELQELECALECVRLKAQIQAISARKTYIRWFFFFACLFLILLLTSSFLWLLSLALSIVFLTLHTGEKGREKQKKAHLEGRQAQAILGIESEPLLSLSSQELEEKKDRLASVASNLASLQEEKKEIEREAQSAFAAKNFSQTIEKIELAKEALAKKREHAKKVLLSRAFLMRVQERYENERQPLVLQKAAEYFRLFSLGSFDLHPLKQELLRIWDKRKERYCKQEELSYGERVQLFLALRLGFLSSSEKGLKLPLFLDEILCHVDDDRFASVSEAIMQVGKERQVFLFTCQRWSFEAWGRLGAHQIDLEELQGKQGKQRATVFAVKRMLAREPLEGEDKSLYAQEMGLAFPSLDVKFTEQPAWIALGNASDVYRMHAMGIKTIGHLLAHFPDDALRVKGDLLKKALELAAIGRSKEVTRSDLERAVKEGVFSSSFLDAVSDCCKQKGGDAKTLLKGLEDREVKRFLGRYLENLKKYFLDQGLLDLREPLTQDLMRKELCCVAPSQTPENVEFISYLVSVFAS